MDNVKVNVLNDESPKSKKSISLKKRLKAHVKAVTGGGLIGSISNAVAVVGHVRSNNITSKYNQKLINLTKNRLHKDVIIHKSPSAHYKTSSIRSKNIHLGGTNMNSAVLAHELGHAEHHHGNMINKNIQGNVGLMMVGRSPVVRRLTSVTTSKLGLDHGIQAEYDNFTGKKSNKRQRIRKGALVAVSTATPLAVLPSEILATHRGISNLKKVGATKRDINKARKHLGFAAATYVTVSLIPAITGLIADRLGRNLAKEQILNELKVKYPSFSKKQLEDIYKKEKLKHKALSKKK